MVTVIDGGFSYINKYINSYIEDSPLWTSQFLVSHPQAVIDTHKAYINAGAEIITTNTYQASIPGFQRHLNLSESDSKKLLHKAVELAMQAKEEVLLDSARAPVKIAGSIGPYGACLHDGSEYSGGYVDEMSYRELIEWHRPRLAILAEAGVDLFAIETIPAIDEALVFCDLLKEFPDKKAWISFTCKDRKHLAHGESFKKAVEKIWSKGSNQLVAIGMNCLSPVLVSSLMSSVADQNIPIIVYPNSGETWDPDLGWKGQEREVNIIDFLPEWISLGVKFLGGCCRTTPDDIKSIREYVDSLHLY